MVGPTILLVEDDESARELIAHSLKAAGYQCSFAGDTSQALELVGQARPALIVTDFMMPAGGGSTLHMRLRLSAATRDIPVLILSAADRNFVLQSVQMDARTYFLAKPYRKDELLALVGEILKQGAQP
jgi:CheY-like chemotaxis protein